MFPVLGESVENLFIIFIKNRFSGHSDWATPGLVSIPEVKSVTFCLVLWGYLREFHFAASLFLQNII